MLEKFKIELGIFVEKNENKLIEIFINSWNGIKYEKEISQLKNFLLQENAGVNYINEKVNQLEDKNISIRFNAVYSHGSPKVQFKFNEKDTCRELADLLVILRINDHNTRSSSTLYSRSFFSQWKLNHSDNKNKEQEFLYDSAENFLMPIWIAGQTDVERTRHFDCRWHSLNFFYLDDKTFIKRPVGKSNIEFSKILLDLLKLDYGLEFNKSVWSNNLVKPTNWDNLMNDLINKVGKEKKIKGFDQPKLIEYKISNQSYFYHIDNEEVLHEIKDEFQEKRFQSKLIIDINFNRRLKTKGVLES